MLDYFDMHLLLTPNERVFGRVVWDMLFGCFWYTYGWKNMWKSV